MSSSAYIVFRVDGDANLGLGHLMRCLTLAKVFNQAGYDILFICSQGSVAACQHIENSKFQLEYICQSDTAGYDAKQCLNIIQDLNVYMLVVDHYQLDVKWEGLIGARPTKLMVIDDLADRQHLCDVLLDSSYGRQEYEYKALTNPECKYLLASDYCLLREEFNKLSVQARLKREQSKKISNILINFGATDHKCLSVRCVDVLQKLKFRGEIHILISSTCQWIQELEKASDTSTQVTLHIDSINVAPLMLSADLAIGSVGTSSWERCCLGLPTIGIVVADNQNNIASQLVRLGVMDLTTIDDLGKSLIDYVIKFDLDKWQGMSNDAFRVCDGLGAQRVKNAVLEGHPAIVLQSMDKQDESILFSWQCEPGNRKYSGIAKIPDIDEHSTWYTSSLNDLSRRMWLVIFNGEKCGYVRLDVQKNTEEVSVLISKKYRKLGLAHGAISELKKLCLFGVLDAQVSTDNSASISLFKSLGFKQIKNSRFQWNTP